MPLMSPSEYKQSLRDGRVVYYRGERVEDVTAHPVIGVAVDHAAIDYEMAEDEPELALVEGPDGPYSRYYHVPENADDLLKRSALIERATALGGTLVILIKEIGTDALFALRLLASYMDKNMGTRLSPPRPEIPRSLPEQRSGRRRRPDRRERRQGQRPGRSGASRLLRPRRGRG